MAAQQLLHFGDVLRTGVLIDWAYLGFLFKLISPYFFACLGISLAVGLSIAGAAWCACPWLYRSRLSTLACAPGPAAAVSATGQSATRALDSAPAVQGHLHHWQQPARRRHPRAAHHVKEPHQVRACLRRSSFTGLWQAPQAGLRVCDAHAVLRRPRSRAQHHLLRGRRYLRRHRRHHPVDALGEPVRRARRADRPVPHPGDDRRLCHLRLGHHDRVE